MIVPSGPLADLIYFKAPERHGYNPFANVMAIRVPNGDEDNEQPDILPVGVAHSPSRRRKAENRLSRGELRVVEAR